jgi:hypothetical protein
MRKMEERGEITDEQGPFIMPNPHSFPPGWFNWGGGSIVVGANWSPDLAPSRINGPFSWEHSQARILYSNCQISSFHQGAECQRVVL